MAAAAITAAAGERLGGRVVSAGLELRRQVRQSALRHGSREPACPTPRSAARRSTRTTGCARGATISISGTTRSPTAIPGCTRRRTTSNLLKTPAITASGAPRTASTSRIARPSGSRCSQSGIEAGYGAEWSVVANAAAAAHRRRLYGAEFAGDGGEPRARRAGIARRRHRCRQLQHSSGDRYLLAGLYPESVERDAHVHACAIRRPASDEVTMQSADVTLDARVRTSRVSTPSGPVGYMRVPRSHPDRGAAVGRGIEPMRTAGVTDLVLDLRYNGGGFAFMASELAYMIAGPAARPVKRSSASTSTTSTRRSIPSRAAR